MREAHRDTRHVIRAATQKQIVKITEQGEPLARSSTSFPVRQFTAEEFRALEISDEELNAAINQAVAEARE